MTYAGWTRPIPEREYLQNMIAACSAMIVEQPDNTLWKDRHAQAQDMLCRLAECALQLRPGDPKWQTALLMCGMDDPRSDDERFMDDLVETNDVGFGVNGRPM